MNISRASGILLLVIIPLTMRAQALSGTGRISPNPVAACQLPSQKPSDPIDVYRGIKRALVERLCWEIVWTDAEQTGMQVPPTGSAALAVYLTPKALFYCSHDLGKCAEYERNELHLGERLKSTSCGVSGSECKAGQADTDSVLAFVHRIDPTLPTVPKPIPAGEIMHRKALRRAMEEAVPVLTMKAHLGTKPEILEHYRELLPPELTGLEDWFRPASPEASDYRSLSIPCFSPSDPVVYVYGDRRALGPLLIAVKWNAEEERWKTAGLIPPLAGAPTAEQKKIIEGYRKTIESIKCSTLEFSSR